MRLHVNSILCASRRWRLPTEMTDMTAALFRPFDLAGTALRNRIVMAPMTRARNPGAVANELTAQYYRQRASAGLIISEGTPVSPQGQGYIDVPGIWSAEQVAGWKLVTEAVHAAQGTIFAQLWHVGRMSHSSLQPDGGQPVSAGTRPVASAPKNTSFVYLDDGSRATPIPPRHVRWPPKRSPASSTTSRAAPTTPSPPVSMASNCMPPTATCSNSSSTRSSTSARTAMAARCPIVRA